MWKLRRKSLKNINLLRMEITVVTLLATIFLSHYVSSEKHPVLTQKIGFAGELKEEDSSNLNTNTNTNNNNNNNNANSDISNNGESSSNRHDIKARSPLYDTSNNNGPYYNPTQRPFYSSSPNNYHPNHRYPNEPVIYRPGDKERYILLKKQPTSTTIVSSTFSPRRLETDIGQSHHHDADLQKFQYGTRPSPTVSPTPVYKRQVYREPSPSPYTNYYTRKPSFDDESTPHPEPKKYAFAYAVKDGHNGDDYSHKESRDGKVTMGEYKVLLPDGRLQVVRYTADAKAGFKADVTYEGEDNYNGEHLAKLKSKPYKPPPPPFYRQAGPEHRQSFDPSPSPTPIYLSSPSPTPIYKLNPFKSYPSISPSIVYKGNDIPASPSFDFRQKSNENSITPTPYGFIKNTPSSPPKNIYEKINDSPGPSSKSYSPIQRGHRAGPESKISSPKSSFGHGARRHRKIIEAAPTPNYISSTTPSGKGKSRLIPIEHFKAGPYTHSPKYFKVSGGKPPYPTSSAPVNNPNQPSYHRNQETHRHEQHYLVVDEHPASPSIEHHHPFNSPPQNHHPFNNPPQNHHPFNNPPQNHHQIQHHEQVHPIHEEYHPPSPTRPTFYHEDSKPGIPPVKSSLATFTSILGGTPKPVLYIKSKPVVGVGRPIKPSVGGLVYLETPGRGIRPNSYGVKELLDRLPDDHFHSIQDVKTTTHPYEIGAKDYGDAVSYGHNSHGHSNSHEEDKYKRPFLASPQIPSEYLVPELNSDHHFDNNHHHNLHSRELNYGHVKDDLTIPFGNNNHH